MNEITEYVTKFNRIIKQLVCDLANRNPNDVDIRRFKDRTNIAIREAPVIVIDKMGPYLYKYKEKIFCGDRSFFIENDYDKEVKQSNSNKNINYVKKIIFKIKVVFKELNENEKDEYIDKITKLLDIYIEYYCFKKNL